MRWVVAGCAFAVLIGLAIGTVAVKAASVAARARMQELERRLLAEAVERARRLHEIHAVTTERELSRRWVALERYSTQSW